VFVDRESELLCNDKGLPLPGCDELEPDVLAGGDEVSAWLRCLAPCADKLDSLDHLSLALKLTLVQLPSFALKLTLEVTPSLTLTCTLLLSLSLSLSRSLSLSLSTLDSTFFE